MHTYFLILNFEIKGAEVICDYYHTGDSFFLKNQLFYPFTNVENTVNIRNFDLRFYDYSEYFVYVIGAWMCFYLFKFLNPKG